MPVQPRQLPNPNRYAVTKPGLGEGIRASLYDFQTYTGATGHTSLSFFQVPDGQGGKTIADTNMKLAGQLSAGNVFVADTLEVYFFPGLSPVTVATALTATNFSNDVYALGKSGSLKFKVLDKDYVEDAPLGRFPPSTGLDVRAAAALDVVEATAEGQYAMDYARMTGKPYQINPFVTIDSTMSFSVKMNWPTAVPLPSTVDGRIGVVLSGIMYRKTQ